MRLALALVLLMWVSAHRVVAHESSFDLPTIANAPSAHWANLPPVLGPLSLSDDEIRRAERDLADAFVIQDCSPTATRCVGGPDSEYATIQLAVNAAVAGDTVLVFDKASSAVYDEPVASVNAGSVGNPITIKAEFDCVSANGTTVVGGVDTPACVSVREIATNDAYIIIQGFEITNQGMTHDTDRLVLMTTGSDNSMLLNSYIHHGSFSNTECIGVAAPDLVIRGNRISHCHPLSTVFSTIFALSFNIQTGVNDKMSFSVQGGAAQDVTLTAGAARTPNQIGTEISNVLMTGTFPSSTGAAACLIGNNCEQIVVVNSLTKSLASSIEVLPIANSAYATLGMAEGLGSPYGWGIAISGTANDLLVENNHISRVSDYFYPGNSTRVVYRDNTAGPNDEYHSIHIDVVQPGGADQVLVENLLAIDGNNVQHHLQLNEGNGSHYIWRGLRTCRHRGAPSMATGTNDLYIYNSTFYDNFEVFQGFDGSQMRVSGASNTRSLGRNNIWWNSLENAAGVYVWDGGAAATDTDYDLWGGGTSSTVLAAQANDVNADPLVTDGPNCNFTLTASSPAIDAGGPLTTVAAADTGSGTTLVLTNARMFQDGWAGVTPDAIAVGTVGNIAQIVASSVDYATGTVTITADISRNDGDPVWWYANSRGTRVLYGAAPDIGAFESNWSESAPVRLRKRPE